MPFLIDTSLWIGMYRDRTGKRGALVKAATGGEQPVFATEAEWTLTRDHLKT